MTDNAIAANAADYAPIVIFAYNRPLHLRRTVEALLRNPETAQSEIFFFSDGPRSEATAETVMAVRQYIRQVTGFKRITIVERERNLGLADSVIQGVSQVCKSHGKVIVLEDDLVTSPYFLKYMNDSLAYYAINDKVVSIHGYTFPISKPVPETFFLRGAGCLGWGTWRRSWDLFEPDGRKLLENLQSRGLLEEFDYQNTYPYSRMLKDQILGRNSSWAIRWHASAFLLDKLTLHPREPLVVHIGNDGTGTHYGVDDFMGDQISMVPISVNPIAVEHDRLIYAKYVEYFKTHSGSIIKKIKAKIICTLLQFKLQ
jgi:hypothetical protein